MPPRARPARPDAAFTDFIDYEADYTIGHDWIEAEVFKGQLTAVGDGLFWCCASIIAIEAEGIDRASEGAGER